MRIVAIGRSVQAGQYVKMRRPHIAIGAALCGKPIMVTSTFMVFLVWVELRVLRGLIWSVFWRGLGCFCIILALLHGQIFNSPCLHIAPARDHLHQKEVARLQLLQQLRRVNRLVKDLRRDGGGPSTSASHAAEDLSEQGGLLNNPLYSSGGASDADFMVRAHIIIGLSPQGLRQDYPERESLVSSLPATLRLLQNGTDVVDKQLIVRTGLNNQTFLITCAVVPRVIFSLRANMLPKVESCKHINPAASWMSLHSCIGANCCVRSHTDVTTSQSMFHLLSPIWLHHSQPSTRLHYSELTRCNTPAYHEQLAHESPV